MGRTKCFPIALLDAAEPLSLVRRYDYCDYQLKPALGTAL